MSTNARNAGARRASSRRSMSACSIGGTPRYTSKLTRTGGPNRAIITSPVGSESAPLTGWARRVAHPVRAGPLSHLIDEWIKSLAKRLPCMLPVQPRYRPTVGQLAKAHTFRFLTMIAAWTLIFAAFIYHPEWIRESLRFMTHSIETFADQVPEPWGSRLEIMLRELGGIIWLQIAIAIVVLRLIIWVPFHLWRLSRDRKIRY
jgi:hypothetical protein